MENNLGMSTAVGAMQPKQHKGSVPPGFSRPLRAGEVPLMACSDHNRHPDAPTSRTYRMVLSASDKQPRGYHGLRLLRLRRIHLKQRWQHLALLIITGLVGLSLIFWNQITFPALIYIQNLRLPVSYMPTDEDVARCSASKLPSLYIEGDVSSWRGLERSELLRIAWETPFSGMERTLDFKTYELNMWILESVSNVLAANHIEYAIVGDTLVGSYLFQDSVFWSRSVDVALREGTAEEVQDSLRKINLVEALDRKPVYAPPQLRKWLVGANAVLTLKENEDGDKKAQIILAATKGGSLKGPLAALRINVVWWSVQERGPEDKSKDFEGNPEVVVLNVPVADGSADTVRVPSSEWFPLTDRPLGMIAVAAPYNSLFYINAQYNQAEPRCFDNGSEKSSHFLSLSKFVASSCSSIHSSYFRVNRYHIKDNCFREVLFYNEKVKSIGYVGGNFRPAEKFSYWFSTGD